METLFEPTADTAWVLNEKDYDALRGSSSESRFAISNGFLGVRGTRAITRCTDWMTPPRTYVAGLFDKSSPELPSPGLIPAADWLQVNISLDGRPLAHHACVHSMNHMKLDMKRGVLITEYCFKSSSVHLKSCTFRLVSRNAQALGLQLIQFEVLSGNIDITFEASFKGLGLGLVSEHLDQDLGVWRTINSAKKLAMADACSLELDGQDLSTISLAPFKRSWSWKAKPGQVGLFQRLIAVTRSDTIDADAGGDAQQQRDTASLQGWRQIVAAHEEAWENRWRHSDVEVRGDAAAQQALRFAIYHLNSAANPADEHVSIGARALTGDDYFGHVFWDTEIFLLPFYSFTWPEAARALLMYRFHTLGGARAKAKSMGWRGALYAWESTDTGEEMTPEHAIGPDRQVIDILCGKQEQHISADVAYAIWQYWLITSDEAFLRDAGAEILLETARFWASRAALEDDGRHHIRNIIGPDEYHENIDDNAFTNVMARWNIQRALDAVTLLRARWPESWAQISGELKLHDAELKQWSNVANSMAIGFDAKTGLYEQFAGYFGLEAIDLANYAGRSVPMDVVLGRERTQRSQVIKQADVIALLALLPNEFRDQAATENYRYYEPRCAHGSSLSRAMHGLVAARLGNTEKALSYFRQTAAIDLADTHVAIAGGVHIAALGGLWLIAVYGFIGLSLNDIGVELNPQLPACWRSLTFRIQWQKRYLKVSIEQDQNLAEIILEGGEPMTVIVWGRRQALSRDKVLRVFSDGSDMPHAHEPLIPSAA